MAKFKLLIRDKARGERWISVAVGLIGVASYDPEGNSDLPTYGLLAGIAIAGLSGVGYVIGRIMFAISKTGR